MNFTAKVFVSIMCTSPYSLSGRNTHIGTKFESNVLIHSTTISVENWSYNSGALITTEVVDGGSVGVFRTVFTNLTIGRTYEYAIAVLYIWEGTA